jgi:transcriptional regulator with XRE-family HTH domain
MDSEPGKVPTRSVTVDQIVAGNIRHWRRAAGMTQEELGRRLGWSDKNVSAAERSADPARDPRRFDAQTLTNLSLALSVPLIALFLPPEDDGEAATYVFSAPDGEHGMDDFMALVVMTDSNDDAPAMEEYRHRFRDAAYRYLNPAWHAEVASWLRHIETPEMRAERAERLRAERDSMIRTARELGSIADAIDPQADPR